jgi:anaerobic selenocysteine-containing dehydrogenase
MPDDTRSFDPPEIIDTSPPISDEVKTTTCYMCACRCGINVHLRDSAIRYIEGNKNHPVNKGVLCAKGSAGIMQPLSPARLSKPLKRVGPRGSNEFVEIEWDEALATASEWLGNVRRRNPRKLAFFTGRDQSQGLTGFWATQFGTPNYAAHGGFCSVNMAAAGLYTIGGSFWEFGEPDWERSRYFMMFGVAEDHDSNPIKAGLGKLKGKGDAKFVSAWSMNYCAPAKSIWNISCATPMRHGWSIRLLVRPMTACSCATGTATRFPSTKPAAISRMRWTPIFRRPCRAVSIWRNWMAN